MSGFELARAIRADPNTRTIPVVFYSASYIAGELGDRDADATVLRVVPKNGDLSALIEAVDDALAR
jgi:CheY-like chemotaxis protein